MLKILEKYSLLGKNSFGVPAVCDFYVQVSSLENLVEVTDHAKNQKLELSILGGGTNLVLGKHIDGLVVHIQIQGKEIIDESAQTICVRVGGGENWHRFVAWTLSLGYFGLENLALIPGSCGAAPVQNIGAYGVEISQLVETVEYYDLQTGEIKRLRGEQCQFGYRDSVFKQSLKSLAVITHVEFRLSKVASKELSYPALADYIDQQELEATPQNIFNAVCALRKSKLPSPDDIPNAGSFFKNPVIKESDYLDLKLSYPQMPCYPLSVAEGEEAFVKIPAAWLIDTLGFKGRIASGVGVHDKQALVLVNPGHRTGDHILAFSADISSSVQKEFNIRLEIEPQIWGL